MPSVAARAAPTRIGFHVLTDCKAPTIGAPEPGRVVFNLLARDAGYTIQAGESVMLDTGVYVNDLPKGKTVRVAPLVGQAFSTSTGAVPHNDDAEEIRVLAYNGSREPVVICGGSPIARLVIE